MTSLARSRWSTAFRLLACVLLLQGSITEAEDTDITVRVIARNAQFVGDLIGGAYITITDAASGEMLAQGKTSGAAGDPENIMRSARKRSEPSAREEDAKFSVTLDIDRPRRVQVTAYGPLDSRFATAESSAARVSAIQWIVPGKHLTAGDGWVLELPGLLVAPSLSASTVTLSDVKTGIRIKAEVMLMCGCLIKPDFYWDPADYEVAAIVHRGAQLIGHFPLAYADVASEFATNVSVQRPGVYDISIYAYHAASGNTGVGQVKLTVIED